MGRLCTHKRVDQCELPRKYPDEPCERAQRMAAEATTEDPKSTVNAADERIGLQQQLLVAHRGSAVLLAQLGQRWLWSRPPGELPPVAEDRTRSCTSSSTGAGGTPNSFTPCG